MTRPVSVVVPALEDQELLERHLPALLEELERRALGDEVVLVDDTGRAVLGPWAAERFPPDRHPVRVVPRAENGGFARALTTGVEAARHALVLSLNPDVCVRPGFLDPLVACLEEEDVAAVAPRVLLRGEEGEIESLAFLELEEGFLHVRQPELRRAEDAPPMRLGAPIPVAFAIGGTSAFRRDEFLERGFDPLFEPFYWEDVDRSWSAWREGRRVLVQPASVVEHHHRGTIGRVVDRDFVRAAIERNRLLFHWKNLDDERALVDHLAALHRTAIDAWIADERNELLWLCLALERADDALAARSARPPARRSDVEVLATVRPPAPPP